MGGPIESIRGQKRERWAEQCLTLRCRGEIYERRAGRKDSGGRASVFCAERIPARYTDREADEWKILGLGIDGLVQYPHGVQGLPEHRVMWPATNTVGEPKQHSQEAFLVGDPSTATQSPRYVAPKPCPSSSCFTSLLGLIFYRYGMYSFIVMRGLGTERGGFIAKL